MTTQSVAEGRVYLHDGTTSSGTITYTTYCINIRAEKIERDMQREVKFILNPKTSTSSTPETYFIDLNRNKETITIYGYLGDDTGESATTKRDNLVNFARTGADTSKEVVWGLAATSGEQKETVTINKLKISEDAKEGGVRASVSTFPKRKIPVIITLVVGENKYTPS